MKIRVFVSSVQKELENERIAVSELVALDPFLYRYVDPVLFEHLPASAASPETAYLDALRNADIYLGILGFKYGRKGTDGFSATHREYREAIRLEMPTYFFVKGYSSQDVRRDEDLKKFFKTIQDEHRGHVYKRFTHYQSLKTEIRRVLLAELRKRDIRPTAEENGIAVQTLAQASDFDSRLVNRVAVTDLDKDLMRQYAVRVTGETPQTITSEAVRRCMINRGLLCTDEDTRDIHPSAAGLLLFARHPDAFFPQARIAANAYGGTERGEPLDRDDICEALPKSVERAFQFLKRNMRHTTRIEGFSKVEIDEYPYEAIREAVVNAVAHRDYDLKGSCIRIAKYADRIEVLSPGLPPEPITLEKIEKLSYIACSRNPNLARNLSFFERIEEQGDGLRRIVESATRMGLRRPEFRFRDGHFVVVIWGPGNDIQKLTSQTSRPVFDVAPTILDDLTGTQRAILRILLEVGESKTMELAQRLKLSRPAIQKALKTLKDNGLVRQRGRTRDAIYGILEETESR